MYKSIFVFVAVLFLTLNQSAFGGFVAYVNYSDDNCTTPVGKFISSGATCPTKRDVRQAECLPVPNSQYFYMEDASTYCNDTSPPEAPEGWYTINLFFRVDICSSKTVSLIQIGLMNTEITMMANILSTGLQAWNVTGSCDETTGTITAEACGKVFGSTFCPSGEFTSECSYNDDYQAAGYQTGCDAPPVTVLPPVSAPVTSTVIPQASEPIAALQNSGAIMTNILVGATVIAAFF